MGPSVISVDETKETVGSIGVYVLGLRGNFLRIANKAF